MSSETATPRRWASMTAVSKPHSPDACSSMAYPSGGTFTVGDSATDSDPDDDIPAGSQSDEAPPYGAAGREGEPPDPAGSSDSAVERITVALIPRAYSALLLLLLLPVLSTIAVVVVVIAWSRDTLAFALMLLAVFLCYGLRNDSDDHASRPGKRIGR